MTDRILRPHCDYSRAYVDDIVIFSATLKEHLHHLRSVFGELADKGICLSPDKYFLGYPSVHLLGQRVNALGLATAEAKLAAITNLEFPRTLTQLEGYLGLTGYLRQYIPRYAAIVKPLQLRKTVLNQRMRQGHGKDTGRSKRRRLARLTNITKPSLKELNAFHHLQKLFSRPTMLSHFLPKRQLYIDLDASKEFGFGAHVYHLRTDLTKPPPDGTSIPVSTSSPAPTQKDTEPILFLSRVLTDAETRYWPTELEVAGIVWVVKKVRHMIEASEQPTIIYTDHSAAVSIVRQSSLNTVDVEKLNLRLVRASEYLQRFRLDVRYKPGKANIVPDALSRLASREYQPESDESSLDALHSSTIPTYANVLVEMSPEFRQRVMDGYTTEARWQRISDMITRNDALDTNAAALPYTRIRGLIYYKDIEKGHRLCIPSYLYGDVFTLAHDSMGHPGYARTHERLTDSLYLPDLSKHLHEYIRHCPQCQLMQTPHHSPYGSMQPILTPP